MHTICVYIYIHTYAHIHIHVHFSEPGLGNDFSKVTLTIVWMAIIRLSSDIRHLMNT